jgi:hypothetical protein
VVALASSMVLNSDPLSLVAPSFDPAKPLDVNGNIIHPPQVDDRDGPPYGLAGADYIVVAAPVQTHLDPAEALFRGAPFSAAFERTGDVFSLRGGVKAHIYRRVGESYWDWLWDRFAGNETGFCRFYGRGGLWTR